MEMERWVLSHQAKAVFPDSIFSKRLKWELIVSFLRRVHKHGQQCVSSGDPVSWALFHLQNFNLTSSRARYGTESVQHTNSMDTS